MTEELHDPKPGGVVVAHSLARIMLVQALRTYILDGARNDLGGLSALSDVQISRAIAAMQEEPAVNWTVERLAGRAGMSRASFALKFKAAAHQSPVEYLTRGRMLLAEDRIATTNDTISEIAQSLGYDSSNAFAKAFKKATGYSPRRHRVQAGTAV